MPFNTRQPRHLLDVKSYFFGGRFGDVNQYFLDFQVQKVGQLVKTFDLVYSDFLQLFQFRRYCNKYLSRYFEEFPVIEVMECFINPGIARIAIIEVPIIEDLLYFSLVMCRMYPELGPTGRHCPKQICPSRACPKPKNLRLDLHYFLHIVYCCLLIRKC